MHFYSGDIGSYSTEIYSRNNVSTNRNKRDEVTSEIYYDFGGVVGSTATLAAVKRQRWEYNGVTCKS